MKYRKLGAIAREISEIGMGCEYLLDKDERTVSAAIRAAINGGVTYFDCHPGHDFGEGSVSYEGYEKFGKAISGFRERLCISYLAQIALSAPDLRTRFENYLRALNTDHTDVFMLQYCDKEKTYETALRDEGPLALARKLRSEGKVRYIGIASHSAEIAHRALASGAFDVLMYPVNPAFDVVSDNALDTLWDGAAAFSGKGKTGSQPRRSVYSECERAGVGLVAMKPFAGGFVFKVEKNAGFTPLNLVSYALTQNGVSTVIPGCSRPEEIEEILGYNSASNEERDYSAAVAASRWSVTENCLYCNHCLPCAAGINVGQVNRLLDAVIFGGDGESVRDKYRGLLVKASACTGCGLCLERCPFGVKVIDRMKQAAKVFEAGAV